MLPELRGEQANLVGLIGLGGAVRQVVRTGEQRVLRGDVDDVAAEVLFDHHARGRLGDQEAALGHDIVLDVPVALGGLQQRLGDGQAGVVHDEIETAEGQQCDVDRGTNCFGAGDIGSNAHCDVRAADLLRHRRSSLGVAVDHDHARPFIGQTGGDRLPDTTGRPRHQRDPPGVSFRLGQAPQLRFLEGPVLDPELLSLVDRRIGGQRLGAAHDVDGVDVELADHTGRLLVLAVREHAYAGHEDDGRVRTARRRRVGRGVSVVVGRVVRSVALVEPGECTAAMSSPS